MEVEEIINEYSKYKWNPSKKTLFLIENRAMYEKESFKKFRESSSNYIKNKFVRLLIFDKYNYRCNYCSSVDELEIDHIKSVFNCFKHKQYYDCNVVKNLQLLCKNCNNKKSHG